jgi:hypothetical protein
MKKLITSMIIVVLFTSSQSFGSLIDTRTDTTGAGATVDQVISANEYGPGNSYSYTGGGSGFGGTLGGGVLYMESDATNLYIGLSMGNAMNDLVAILLDTKAGGFTDAGMSDNGDGCRRALTELSVNADDAYDPNFLPDYGVCLGNFGSVYFELTAVAPINFLDFNGTGSQPVREYTVSLASLGVSALQPNIDFFAAYISDSGFGSNESIPAYAPLNGGPNPGFEFSSPGYGNYDRFTIAPEPGTLTLLAIGGLALIRRRR